MTYKMTCSALSVVLLMTLFAAASANAQDDQDPRVFFPSTQYEFASVLDGDRVVHDFIIQNKGTAVLTVDRVKTG